MLNNVKNPVSRKQDKPGAVVSVYFSDENCDILNRLDRIKQLQDRSRNYLIVEAVQMYVKAQDRSVPFLDMRPAHDDSLQR